MASGWLAGEDKWNKWKKFQLKSKASPHPDPSSLLLLLAHWDFPGAAHCANLKVCPQTNKDIHDYQWPHAPRFHEPGTAPAYWDSSCLEGTMTSLYIRAGGGALRLRSVKYVPPTECWVSEMGGSHGVLILLSPLLSLPSPLCGEWPGLPAAPHS